MSFVCPACSQSQLKITGTLELPAHGDDDEVALQIVQCRGCGAAGVAVYRESRHGNLQSESWHHDGYFISPTALTKLRETIKLCPSPADRKCGCAAHTELGNVDWSNPAENGIAIRQRFEMRRAQQ